MLYKGSASGEKAGPYFWARTKQKVNERYYKETMGWRGTGELGQWLECFLYKHGNMPDPQHAHKSKA